MRFLGFYPLSAQRQAPRKFSRLQKKHPQLLAAMRQAVLHCSWCVNGKAVLMLPVYVAVLGVFSAVSAAAGAKRVFEVTMAAYY